MSFVIATAPDVYGYAARCQSCGTRSDHSSSVAHVYHQLRHGRWTCDRCLPLARPYPREVLTAVDQYGIPRADVTVYRHLGGWLVSASARDVVLWVNQDGEIEPFWHADVDGAARYLESRETES